MNENLTIYYCKSCSETYNNVYKGNQKNAEFGHGYIGGWGHGLQKCPFCGSEIIDTNIPDSDFSVIRIISNYNRTFLEAMIKLHDENIIEYETKMAQFRIQAQQMKAIINQEKQESAKPKCPKCGSTNIVTGQRGFSLLTGFLGSNKTVNRCSNCGHTWKPKG